MDSACEEHNTSLTEHDGSMSWLPAAIRIFTFRLPKLHVADSKRSKKL